MTREPACDCCLNGRFSQKGKPTLRAGPCYTAAMSACGCPKPKSIKGFRMSACGCDADQGGANRQCPRIDRTNWAVTPLFNRRDEERCLACSCDNAAESMILRTGP